MKQIKNRRGVSLVELLVVLCIIILLLSLALPKFLQTINTAKETAFDSAVASLEKAATLHILSGGGDAIWAATAGDKARSDIGGAHESWYAWFSEYPSNPLGTGDFVVEIKGETIQVSPGRE